MLHRPGTFIDPACPANWAHPLNRGLVGWWMVPPNSGWRGGLTLRDLVRGGRKPNDGTLTNGPTWVGRRPGGYGALSFDGVDDYVSIADAAPLRPNSVTIGVSFSLANFPTFATLVSKPYNGPPWSSPYISWLIRLNSSAQIEMDVGSGGVYSNNIFSFSTSLATSYRAHMTYDGTTLTSYINGQSVNTSTAVSGAIAYSAGVPLLIGADYGAAPVGDLFPGVIDDVAVWSRSLSAAEIKAEYVQSLRGHPDMLNWAGRRSFSTTVAAAGGSVGNPYYYRMLAGIN